MASASVTTAVHSRLSVWRAPVLRDGSSHGHSRCLRNRAAAACHSLWDSSAASRYRVPQASRPQCVRVASKGPHCRIPLRSANALTSNFKARSRSNSSSTASSGLSAPVLSTARFSSNRIFAPGMATSSVQAPVFAPARVRTSRRALTNPRAGARRRSIKEVHQHCPGRCPLREWIRSAEHPCAPTRCRALRLRPSSVQP